MTDGDFTVTFPQGTIITANGFYVIGSSNSGGPVDLNIGTCGCTSGSGIGTYTNTGEQVVLVNSTGLFEDGIYWFSGQFPINISTTGIFGCPALSISFPDNSGFENIGDDGGNGNTKARVCDGSLTWETRTGNAITMGTANGQSSNAAFTSSDSDFCEGTCISFSDLSSNGASSWSWFFPGASVTNSSSQNPSSICYPTPGNFDVTLIEGGTCGFDTLTKPFFIHVVSPPSPFLVPDSSISICSNASISFQSANSYDSYQWYLNGTAIVGATLSSYIANAAGNYSITVDSGGCSNSSAPVNLSIIPSPTAEITPPGSMIICNGNSISLDAGPGFSSYEWLLNESVIAGETSSNLITSLPGNYQVIVSNSSNCIDTSSAIEITVAISNTPVISSSTGSFSFCKGEMLQLFVPDDYNTYQWYYSDDMLNGETTYLSSVSSAGSYYVIVADSFGCADTSLSVMVTDTECAGIFLPTAFSPNGDGTNDLFSAITEGFPSKFDMKIFDRWGEEVFSTDNISSGWDGTYKGEPCEIGTYIWIVKALDEIGKPMLVNGNLVSGNVTLVR